MPTYRTHKQQREALASLLASSARAAVLRLFLLDPARAYYQRQIEAVTGLAIRAVQRELDRLTAVGLLYRREEGNRAYYHVDTEYALFPELRTMVLKTSTHEERLRGLLAAEEIVRLAFLHEADKRILVVTSGGARPNLSRLESYAVEIMSSEEFSTALEDTPSTVSPFLRHGKDLLGRREDIMWRRIEKAGFNVEKGKGVA